MVLHDPGSVAFGLILGGVAVLDRQQIGKVSMPAAQVSVEFVKAPAKRVKFARCPQMLLADELAAIANRFQCRRQGFF